MKFINTRNALLLAGLALVILFTGCAVGQGYPGAPYGYGSSYGSYGNYGYYGPYYGGYYGRPYYRSYSGGHPSYYQNPQWQYRRNQQRFAEQYWKNKQTFDWTYERNRQRYNRTHPGSPVPPR